MERTFNRGVFGRKNRHFSGRNFPDKSPKPGNRVHLQKPSAKTAKTDRALKKTPKRGNSLQKKIREKNGQNFPLHHIKKTIQRPGFWGRLSYYDVTSQSSDATSLSNISGIFSEQLSGGSLQCKRQSSIVLLASQRGPKGRAEKKKTWGGKKTCSVKRACEGARKRPPPHTERPWTPCVRGSLAPQANKKCRQNPKKGGVHSPRARGAPPGPHSGEGLGRSP